MTEGNISGWRVKEGDSFSAGDVLLEIETDKATMDVEAQDDGIMFKIMQGDGTKAVKVGDRIGVTAEEGDDLGSMEVPAEDKSASSGQPARKDRPSPQEETEGGLDTTESSPSSVESPPSSKPNADASAGGAADTTPAKQKAEGAQTEKSQGGKPQKQKYPLYPAVQHLLHQNGLSNSDAEQIPASGPSGRLLKGDVLAYLGKIEKDYPSKSQARLSKLGHLDLSNIQVTKPEPKKEQQPAGETQPTEPEAPRETEIALPISLTTVIATQKRVQDTLGIFLPLSTFIARASELANDDLPLPKNRQPSSDDLFNSIVGLDKVSPPKTSSRGHYVPQVTGLSPMPPLAPKKAQKPDIIDMLSSPKKAKQTPLPTVPGAVGVATGSNVFSVSATQGEEGRATEYLERLKLALEKEPGRLVL